MSRFIDAGIKVIHASEEETSPGTRLLQWHKVSSLSLYSFHETIGDWNLANTIQVTVEEEEEEE